MPFITISSGLTIKVPTRGTKTWDETLRTDTFAVISAHDHSGSGNGLQLSATGIATDAVTGVKILLANDQFLRGRNAANSADKNILKVNASDEIEFGTTVGIITIQDDGLTILDNADNTKIIAFDASGITTATTRTLTCPDASGIVVLRDDTATLTNKSIDSDNNTITNIVNADIKAAAAIAVNKLAATTVSRALASDASGFITVATTTAAELEHVNGVTSAIQTQIDGKIGAATVDTLTNKTIDADGTGNSITNIEDANIKAAAAIDASKLADGTVSNTELQYINTLSSNAQTQISGKLPTTITTTGDVIYSSSGSTAARLGIGSAGEVLTVSGGIPSWAAVSVTPTGTVTKTTTYTATTADDVILADTSGGAWTLTLPAASGNNGEELTIKKTTSDTTALTIDGNAAETIDGSTTQIMYYQFESMKIVCDGSNWHIIQHDFPTIAAVAYRNATQTLTTGTPAKIAFNAVVFDTHSLVDITTNNRIDIISAGKYRVTASVSFASSATANRGVDIYKNGSNNQGFFHQSRAADSNQGYAQTSGIMSLAAGDYLELMAYQDSGGNLDTRVTNNETYLAIERVG